MSPSSPFGLFVSTRHCSKFKYCISPQKKPLPHSPNTLQPPQRKETFPQFQKYSFDSFSFLGYSSSNWSALLFFPILSLLHLNMSFIFLELFFFFLFFFPACISTVTLFFISLLYFSSVKRVLCSLIFTFFFYSPSTFFPICNSP